MKCFLLGRNGKQQTCLFNRKKAADFLYHIKYHYKFFSLFLSSFERLNDWRIFLFFYFVSFVLFLSYLSFLIPSIQLSNVNFCERKAEMVTTTIYCPFFYYFNVLNYLFGLVIPPIFNFIQ